MINPSQLRCYRNFTPLRIINVPKGGQVSDLYKVIKDENYLVATFKLGNDGEIASLNMKKRLRRKKISAQALLSIFDFCKKKAKENGWDFLWCYGYDNNKNNVTRLYGKVGYTFNALINKYFVIPLTENGNRYVKSLQTEFVNFDFDNLKKITVAPQPINIA